MCRAPELCVGSRRSLFQAPVLSVSAPELCVGLALCIGALCRAPALFVLGPGALCVGPCVCIGPRPARSVAGPDVLWVGARRSVLFTSGPGALCVGPRRSFVSGPGALCVGTRRSQWRALALSATGPALSVSGPTLSVSRPGRLCIGAPWVGARRSLSLYLCRAPALSVSGPGAIGVRVRRSWCGAPALSVSFCVRARCSLRRASALSSLCRDLCRAWRSPSACVGPGALSLSVSGPDALCVGARCSLCRDPVVSRSLSGVALLSFLSEPLRTNQTSASHTKQRPKPSRLPRSSGKQQPWPGKARQGLRCDSDWPGGSYQQPGSLTQGW